MIFGHLKVFVPLPHRPIRKAYLATLDPIDGDEAFSEVDPIGSRSVPTTIQLPEMMVHLNEMNEMLIDRKSVV